MKWWMLVAGVAMASACTKQEVEELGAVGDAGKCIEIVATGDGARTVFGPSTDEGATYPVFWKKNAEKKGESIKVNMNLRFKDGKREMLKDPSTGNNPRVKGEGATTSFNISVADDGSGSYEFYAVCPGSCWSETNDKSTTPALMRLDIPATQSPIAPAGEHNGSCDPLAQLIFAKSEPVTTLPESLTMQFKHVAAYGLLSLTGLTEEDAVTLVRITSSQPIAGKFFCDTETGEITRNTSGLEFSIVLNVQSASSIWFAAAPTDLSNTSLWVTAVAANGNVWVKKLALGDNRALKSGRIAKFSVALSDADMVNAGSIYYENGQAAGVVYSDATTERRVVSAKRMDADYWASATTATDVSDQNNGATNTETLSTFATTNSITMPMLDFCAGLGDGWYWPAYKELQALCAAYHGVASVSSSDLAGRAGTSSSPKPYPADETFPIAERKAQLAFDALLCAAGGDAMNYANPNSSYGDRYWVSSEHSTTTKALYVQFGAYQGSNSTKNSNKYYGRAIKVIAKDASEIPSMEPNIRYGTTREGVTIGSTSDRQLDLYLPAATKVMPEGGWPVFLFVHGGGFSGGNKYDSSKSDGGSNAKICMAMAERGFAAVSINYYLGLKHDNDSNTSCSEEMKNGLPASGAFSTDLQNAIDKASEDAAVALDWIKTHANNYQFNTSRVAVAGGSAGAITVLDLAYLSGQTACPIHAVVDLWGGVADPSKIQSAPPTLIYHGTKDELVNYDYSVKIAERLKELGVRCDFKTLEGKGHGEYTYIINSRMDEIAEFLNSL